MNTNNEHYQNNVLLVNNLYHSTNNFYPMNTYQDCFARVFDKMHGQYTMALANLYYQISGNAAQEAPLERKTLLDLCCGPGQAMQLFCSRNFEVTGIDLSESMLELAKERNKQYVEANTCHFIHGDVVNFELNKDFDMIISTGESLNHISTKEDLFSVLLKSAKHLKEDGCLIFDVTSEKGIYETKYTKISEDEDLYLTCYSTYRDDINEASFIMSGFIKNTNNDHFQRFYENHKLYAYKWKAIDQLLRDAGFKKITYISKSSMQALTDPDSESRYIIKATKK